MSPIGVSLLQAFEIALQHWRLGQHALAGALCRQLLAADPVHAGAPPFSAEAQYALGGMLRDCGLLEAAIAAYQRALTLRPEAVPVLNDLGVTLHQRERFAEAIAVFRSALALAPDAAAVQVNLGNALVEQGEHDGAVAAFRAAIAVQPDLAAAHYNLGNAWKARGRCAEAAAEYRAAVQAQPDFADALHNLSSVLRDQGALDEAIAFARQAVAAQPHESLRHSHLLYSLQFHPSLTPAAFATEHARWNETLCAPLRAHRQPHPNVADPERRLRIGFVSPDFYFHAVSFFLVPLLETLDRAPVEVCCYSDLRGGDLTTERLRKTTDLWRDTRGLSHDDLAARIREDRIDILFDLALHTGSNRLPVFARKPAPVQVSWLAYPGSTGLETIDYRLADAFLEPASTDLPPINGQPWRLPDAWCCYAPFAAFPEVGLLPALVHGQVTFGSLNKFARVQDAVLECWAQLLGAVADSRLLLLCPEGEARARVLRCFAEHGVAAGRIEWVEFAPWPDYVRLFERIDIALDPFPGNGLTTTCHALWMGAPVVSLAGATPLGRAGLSLLSAAGLPELVATSADEYLRIATSLAADLPRLAELRGSLRERLRSSPLLDAPRFARDFESALRGMWRRWCERRSPLAVHAHPGILPRS